MNHRKAGLSASYYTKHLSFPLQPSDGCHISGNYYIPSIPENILWGRLPNRDSKCVLSVPSGSTVTIDTLSHEGMLEDHGRCPSAYFGRHSISEDMILDDSKAIAACIEHSKDDGSHIITGPIAVQGAEPGDVLKVEVLELFPRVPYGVISSRKNRGALPKEFPVNSAEDSVSLFAPIEQTNGAWYGYIEDCGGKITFPIKPFFGIMGTAPDTSGKVNSVPPINTGGNLDIHELGIGSVLYLPVEVPGAKFYAGDPHFAQGNGEVSLTALEGSLRGTVRLTLLKAGDINIPKTAARFSHAFAETEKYWIPIGLGNTLDEAMEQAVRKSVDFLANHFCMDRTKAYLYLSAGADYEVSQVVDRTKGIHALIPKADFKEFLKFRLKLGKDTIPASMHGDRIYAPLIQTLRSIGFKGVCTDAHAITAKRGNTCITVSAGSAVYKRGNESFADVPPFIDENNVFMLPVSALAAVFGAAVNWSTEENTVTATVEILN